jgi:acyl-CoA synthetase (AMP-forming)/AMP-acid ligase II
MTPQILREILAAPDGALSRDDSIALFVTGGALSGDLANAAIARLTRRLHTHLASTETSTFALTPIETAEDLLWHRVLPHCDVQVVDEADRLRPIGEEGQLRVRVDHGATEYLGDTATSGAFFRGGFFYTGDLAVVRADGRLNLRGRVTEVINVDGDKRAAGPMEDQIQRALGVAAVCVLSVPDTHGEEQVHVALETEGPVDRDLLASALGDALPGVPRARVHTVAALPRNDMGKIQRDVLRRQLLG